MTEGEANQPEPTAGLPQAASSAPGKPAAPRAAPASGKVLVEANDWAAAEQHLERIRQEPAGETAAAVRQLSPGLHFSQAQPCGRFWMFDYKPSAGPFAA